MNATPSILALGATGSEEEIVSALPTLVRFLSVPGGGDGVRRALEEPHHALVLVDDDALGTSRDRIYGDLRDTGRPFLVLSSERNAAAAVRAKRQGACEFIGRPYHPRELLLRLDAILSGHRRITCIGGGTGLYSVLAGLKTLPDVLVTSVVSMADDGGSSGRLRASFGILPPGDVRRSLVALSDAPELMNRVMQYRFDRGEGLAGHSLGNLILTALADVHGSMPAAIRSLGDILNVQGIVLPVTEAHTALCARFEDGTEVRGESRIDLGADRPADLRIRHLWQEPPAAVDVNAFAAVVFADLVIIGPGDLYTSVIANLVIDGLPRALAMSDAPKVYVCNLMTKPGETAGFGAEEHVAEVVRYLGEDVLDHVLVSVTDLTPEAIGKYAGQDQHPVRIGSDAAMAEATRAVVVRADVGHASELVRHDHGRLAAEIRRIKDALPPARP